MSQGRRVALGAGVGCMALALVALAVLAHETPYFPIDLTITHRVQALHVPWLDAPMHLLNAVGFKPIVGFVDGAILLALLLIGARWEAVSGGIAALGAVGANYFVKWLVGRPRPPSELVHVEHHLDISNSSFPAGHVLSATAFYGFLCYAIWVRLAPSWRRVALIVPLVSATVLMGLARIDSGEHWPSDVLGGYLVGGLLLVGTIGVYRLRRKRSEIGERGRVSGVVESTRDRIGEASPTPL